MSTVKENLIAARALIDTPAKWVQGAPTKKGRHCAFEAIKVAMSIGPFLPIVAFVERYVPKSFKKSMQNGFRLLIQYNDAQTTTHADIMALFDRAIAACDGQVAA